jgi:DNA uptake protein ComE-like DNA-binding protein
VNEPPENEQSWVPAELGKREPAPAEAGRAPEEGSPAPPDPETSEWLPEGAGGVRQAQQGALEARVSAAEAAAREAEDARRQLELGHAREVDRLASRLAHTESALAEQREEVQRVLEEAEKGADAYDARIAEIQQQVAGFERAADEATERIAAATSGGRQDAGGRTELNSVTVESLRALGLSITQAARLVAHRKATGGFRSAEDVAAVPGLSAAQRQALVERVYVDPTLAGATPR